MVEMRNVIVKMTDSTNLIGGDMTDELICNHCKLQIAIRNPSGKCDHLYYPFNCKVCEEMME